MNAVDTNVLIYACDGRDTGKQATAINLIGSLTDAVLPWQVACEFIAASRKLGPQGLTPDGAWARLDEFCALMPIVPPSPGALAAARSLHVDRGVAFSDAILLGSCIEAGVTTLHSEDTPGASIDGVRVVNPFI